MEKRKILVVVDCQNDFITGSLGTKEAQAIVPNVVEKIKNHYGWIIATQDTHFRDYPLTQEGRNLPIKHCIKGTDGWQIHREIMRAIEDHYGDYTVKPKFTFGEIKDLISFDFVGNDGFIYTCVPDDGDIESIEIVGLCTDICVISNALILKARYPETKIIVDAACCAGVTPATHRAALEVMKMCQIEVINDTE